MPAPRPGADAGASVSSIAQLSCAGAGGFADNRPGPVLQTGRLRYSCQNDSSSCAPPSVSTALSGPDPSYYGAKLPPAVASSGKKHSPTKPAVHEQKETPQREAERRRRDSCSGLIPEAHPPVGDALATAKLIQTALSQAEWPAPRRNPGGSGELRVQMGVHYGRPTAERDRSTHRVVYLGPVVHRASYACCYAKGGELVMTDDAFQELSQLEISGWDSADLGPVALPDFVSRTVLHSFVPRKPKSTAAPAVQEPRGPFPCGRIDVAAPHAPFAQVPLSSHWKVSLQDTRARIQAACDEISGYVLPQHQLRQPAQAPPPKGTVCFVFCDVEATQDMWSRASDAMKPALSSLQQ
eukprot:gene19276-29699_t